MWPGLNDVLLIDTARAASDDCDVVAPNSAANASVCDSDAGHTSNRADIVSRTIAPQRLTKHTAFVWNVRNPLAGPQLAASSGVESVPPRAAIGPEKPPLACQRAPNRTTAPTRNANALGKLRPPETLILSAGATTIAAWASTLADGTYV